MDGFLNIDKPSGMTSHDVVARVRRVLQTKRAGHAGTLDPDAVGVLLVAVGQATKLLPYIPTEPKRYVARIAFGTATNTEDASGTTITEADASTLTQERLRAVLSKFTGKILQVPPMVSAVHHEGRRLYELAREGVTVERQPRPAVIHSLSVSDFAPGPRAEATLDVVCGSGTYIRTLCVDIGAALDLPAHMKHLSREAVGSFTRTEAVSLVSLDNQESAISALLLMENVLDFKRIDLLESDKERVDRGQTVEAPIPATDDEIIALLYGGKLRALARCSSGQYQPFRVFPPDEGKNT